MHGVQPIAKIAPSANARAEPGPSADEAAAEPSPTPPSAAARRRERHAAGHRREARRRAGVQRPPRALEDADAQDPGEAEAHHDRITPPMTRSAAM